MLERQGGQVCVGDEIGLHARGPQQLPKDRRMSFGWLRDPYLLAAEPILNLTPCGAHRLGMLEYPAVGDDTEEGEQARPGKPDAPRPVQLLVEPSARLSVLIERSNMGVEQEIGVDEDHANDSVSLPAITSAMLSMLT